MEGGATTHRHASQHSIEYARPSLSLDPRQPELHPFLTITMVTGEKPAPDYVPQNDRWDGIRSSKEIPS